MISSYRPDVEFGSRCVMAVTVVLQDLIDFQQATVVATGYEGGSGL